jgi:hypothetical protein
MSVVAQRISRTGKKKPANLEGAGEKRFLGRGDRRNRAGLRNPATRRTGMLYAMDVLCQLSAA